MDKNTDDYTTNEEFIWREYQHLSNFYTSYLNLTVQYNTFYYGFVGVIFGIVLNNYENRKQLAFVLLVPAFVSLALCYISWAGIPEVSELGTKLGDLRRALKFRLAPHTSILSRILYVAGGLH